MRSWIVVPADKDNALASVAAAGADVVVVDLARGGNAEKLAGMRGKARDFLASHQRQVLAARRFERWARVAPLDAPHWRDDVEAVMEAQPDGLVLPACRGADQIQQFASVLYEVEQRLGLNANSTRMLPELGSSAAAALAVGQLAQELHPRVTALSWDAVGLARAIGARRTRGPGGAWSDPLAFLRAHTLLVAHARGIDAIEPAYGGGSDTEGGKRAAEAARADGFAGMFAIHPAQIPVVNAAFAATPEERSEAEQLVSAFALSPNAESLAFKGRRVGQADLHRARRVLDEG